MDQDTGQLGHRGLSRRRFLALTGTSVTAMILASCAAPAAPAPAAPPASAPPPPAPTAAPAAAAAPPAAPAPTAAAVPAAPAIGPAEKTKIVWSTWNPNYANEAIIFIAIDKGFYKDEGLEVQVVDTDQGLEGAVGGSIDIAHQDTGPFVAAWQKGIKAKAIAPWRTAEFLGFVVKKEIESQADLNANRVFVDVAKGDRSQIMRQQMLKDDGLDTEKAGVQWIQMSGGSDPKAMAFVDGKIDGTLILPRHIKQVEPVGRIVYMNKITWPQECLIATDAFIAKNPNAITRFLRATLKARQIFAENSNKDYVIKMMTGKGFKIAQMYVDSYEYETVQYTPDGSFEVDDMTKLLQSWGLNPLPKIAEFMDVKYLNAAQSSLGLKPRPTW